MEIFQNLDALQKYRQVIFSNVITSLDLDLDLDLFLFSLCFLCLDFSKVSGSWSQNCLANSPFFGVQYPKDKFLSCIICYRI